MYIMYIVHGQGMKGFARSEGLKWGVPSVSIYQWWDLCSTIEFQVGGTECLGCNFNYLDSHKWFKKMMHFLKTFFL